MTNHAYVSRFRNFWSNVRLVTIAETTPDETSVEIIIALRATGSMLVEHEGNANNKAGAR